MQKDIPRARACYQQAEQVLSPALAAFLAKNKLPFLDLAIAAYTERSSASTVALVIALGMAERLEDAREILAASVACLVDYPRS